MGIEPGTNKPLAVLRTALVVEVLAEVVVGFPAQLATVFATVFATGRSVVAEPVMKATVDPRVLLGGLAPLCVRDDVIDLAPSCGDFAEGVGAVLVSDLDGPSGGPSEESGCLRALDTGTGAKDDPFEAGPLQPGQKGARGDNGAPFDLADAPMECLIAHQDAEEGLRTPVGRLRALGAHRHLDQSVGPSLCGGAGKLVDPWIPPERLFGARPFGFEELVLDPGELAGDDGARNRVEGPAQEVHPVPALSHIGVTPGPTRQVALFGPVGVGHLG